MLSFKSLPLLITISIALSGCTGDNPNGKQLIENHFARSLTYSAASQSYQLAGQMRGDDGQMVEISVHIKGPERVRVRMSHPDSTKAFFEGWTNGRQAWANGELCTLCMAEDRSFDALNPVFKLLMGDHMFRKTPSELRYSGQIGVGGETLNRVDFINIDADSVRLLFNANTGLLHQIEGGEVSLLRFKDYRGVGDGRMLPYRIEGDYDGTYLEIDLREVQLDELPDAIFEIPDQSS
ncbi:MAG: hypothetical protein AB8G77_10235 [Rhodothermales bacterium]